MRIELKNRDVHRRRLEVLLKKWYPLTELTLVTLTIHLQLVPRSMKRGSMCVCIYIYIYTSNPPPPIRLHSVVLNNLSRRTTLPTLSYESYKCRNFRTCN
jgi:hypothetical protein